MPEDKANARRAGTFNCEVLPSSVPARDNADCPSNSTLGEFLDFCDATARYGRSGHGDFALMDFALMDLAHRIALPDDAEGRTGWIPATSWPQRKENER